MIQFRSKSALLAPIVLAAALTTVSVSSASTVIEDFSYATGAIANKNGGSSWSGVWGASTGTGSITSRVLVNSTQDLTFSLGGYNVPQSGTGSVYGNFNAFRGINRTIDTNLSGTIWFSVLINNAEADDHAGLQFNNHADSPYTGTDYAEGPFHVEVFGTDVLVRYGGTTSASVGTLTLGTTHLLLGRITMGAGNDRLELWADPADVFNPGLALFNQESADMGNSLFLAGVFSYGNADFGTSAGAGHGKLDALRLSDGDGNPVQALQNVVSVPEPSSAILFLTGGILLGGLRRSSRSRTAV